MEAELARCRARLRAVEAQLLEVLEEKLRLQQEVEAWEVRRTSWVCVCKEGRLVCVCLNVYVCACVFVHKSACKAIPNLVLRTPRPGR